MYAKNLQISVLTAVADLRWQVAKEKASYYWMEEGLTGNYYQWFQAQKIKGDVKGPFHQRLPIVDAQGKRGDPETLQGSARGVLAVHALLARGQGQAQAAGDRLPGTLPARHEPRAFRRLLSRPWFLKGACDALKRKADRAYPRG